MAVEINEKLGLKFSSAVLPSVKWPDPTRSAVCVDATTASVVLLDGTSGGVEEINEMALAVLGPGLSDLNGEDLEQMARQMKELFIRTSKEVAGYSRGYGIISATAIKLISPGPDIGAFCYSHVGRNRIYKLNFEGGYDVLTVDSGGGYEKRIMSFSKEDMQIARALDTLTAEEFSLLKSPYGNLLWVMFGNLPAEHLISKDPPISSGWQGFVRGDRLLLSSMGVHRSLNSREIIEILKNEQDPAAVLAGQAQVSSSKQDYFRATPYRNYAAIVVEKL